MCVCICFVWHTLKHTKISVEILQIFFWTGRSQSFIVWEFLNHIWNDGALMHVQDKLTNSILGIKKICDNERTIQVSVVFSYFLWWHTKTRTDLYIDYTLLADEYVTSGMRLTSPWLRLKPSFSQTCMNPSSGKSVLTSDVCSSLAPSIRCVHTTIPRGANFAW